MGEAIDVGLLSDEQSSHDDEDLAGDSDEGLFRAFSIVVDQVVIGASQLIMGGFMSGIQSSHVENGTGFSVAVSIQMRPGGGGAGLVIVRGEPGHGRDLARAVETAQVTQLGYDGECYDAADSGNGGQ